MNTPGFFLYWLIFTVLILIVVAAFIFWAIRSRQFSDQRRARHLALWAGMPEDEKESDKLRGKPLPDAFAEAKREGAFGKSKIFWGKGREKKC